MRNATQAKETCYKVIQDYKNHIHFSKIFNSIKKERETPTDDARSRCKVLMESGKLDQEGFDGYEALVSLNRNVRDLEFLSEKPIYLQDNVYNQGLGVDFYFVASLVGCYWGDQALYSDSAVLESCIECLSDICDNLDAYTQASLEDL